MAGLIPDNTLEQIRAANDIVDVIGGYLPLKRAGANFTALCPFHKEKSPSFNVNPHKQIFHCFGCHKGGDVFTFVKEYENIGFVDAVRRLAFFKAAIANSPALARRLIAATFPNGIVASPVERGKKRRFWLSGEASFGVLFRSDFSGDTGGPTGIPKGASPTGFEPVLAA